MAELQDVMPPGWDCKTEYRTGKQYYVNHYTKTTTWEDPRNKHRYHGTPLHVSTGMEYMPMQHGSPDLRRNYIYPSQPSPIPAFQMPGQYSPKYIPLQEMRSTSRMSPLSIRTARIQDSSFTNVPDTDDSVAKISGMFPTVSDTHIRLLLKKYHGREAVVISALQVEKHPITTPGPFATPPPTRNIHAPLQMTPPLGVRTASSRNSSPILRTTSGTNSTYTGSPRVGDNYRNSPRPHSSPKLKLRYMKSIFPQAEETVILEILSSNENNIQKASDVLKEMGFDKKDTIKLYQLSVEAKAIEEKAKADELARPAVPPAPPRIITSVEKEKIKSRLQVKYKDIPEHVIHIALESVHFEEDRANQILQIMVQEDEKDKMKEIVDRADVAEIPDVSEVDHLTIPSVPQSQSRQSLKSLLKEKSDINKEKISFSRVIEECSVSNQADYKSTNISNTNGCNPEYARGPNEKLLLEDYVKWQGPNPNFYAGEIKEKLAKGPNNNLLIKTAYQTCGPNSELRKGPKFGLAKGSIFSQMKGTILVGESRGK